MVKILVDECKCCRKLFKTPKKYREHLAQKVHDQSMLRRQAHLERVRDRMFGALWEATEPQEILRIVERNFYAFRRLLLQDWGDFRTPFSSSMVYVSHRTELKHIDDVLAGLTIQFMAEYNSVSQYEYFHTVSPSGYPERDSEVDMFIDDEVRLYVEPGFGIHRGLHKVHLTMGAVPLYFALNVIRDGDEEAEAA